ncbi:MAG: TadE/TadG family type IV pilus assembly protein [Candidatus Dormiibacterota bacterium]
MPAILSVRLLLRDLYRRVAGGTGASEPGDSGRQAIDRPGRRPSARGVVSALALRGAHSRSRGTSAVEFALVGPTAFLLLLGAVVLGVVVTHEIQLSQAVRDSARAAAICGGNTGPSTTTTLPDGTPCTTAKITAYINARVDGISPSLANQAVVTVFNAGGTSVGTTTGGAATSLCAPGYTVEVAITYQQPLYIPFIGALVGNASTNTRTISAQGEATCEQ